MICLLAWLAGFCGFRSVKHNALTWTWALFIHSSANRAPGTLHPKGSPPAPAMPVEPLHMRLPLRHLENMKFVEVGHFSSGA